MGGADIIVYLKTTDLEYIFNPELDTSNELYDGFNRFDKASSAIETADIEISFIAPKGKRPDVKIYFDPEIIYSANTIANYGTDATSELYDSINQVCKLPKVYNGDTGPVSVYLVIAEAVSDSGINFTYDKTPKFREQETPHVYFDTVKGGSTRTETHTYTYEDASVTGTGTRPSPITGDEEVLTFYKVHDFMTPEELIGQILGNTIPEEAAITNEDIDDLSEDALFQNYPGTIKFMATLGKRGGGLISLDSAYTYDNNAGNSVSFPEPGVYLLDDSILTIAKEVQTSPSPFSKNVTVKAHTEYTAHINGRIGESGSSVLNAYGFSKTGNWSATDDPYIKVADCDGLFEIAKSALLAGRKVIGFINNTDNQAVHPILFESIVENWFESGMNGIRADAGLHNFLLASDNKLYHMLPSY